MTQPNINPTTARTAAAQAGTASLGHSAGKGLPGRTVVGTVVKGTSGTLFIRVKMKGCSWRSYEEKTLIKGPFKSHFSYCFISNNGLHWLFTHLCGTADLTAVICEVIVVLFTAYRLQLKQRRTKTYLIWERFSEIGSVSQIAYLFTSQAHIVEGEKLSGAVDG